MKEGRIFKTEGLVIRSAECSDGDLIYTVLTKDSGRQVIKARPPSKSLGIMQQKIGVSFYMEFVLYKKGPLCWIRESTLKEPFFNLRSNLSRMALSEYFLDVAYELSFDGQECADILSVTSNCLYALNYMKDYPIELIKAAFELKAMSVSGYMPAVTHCRCCKKLDGDLYLDVNEGGIICSSCLKKEANRLPYVAPEDMDFHATEKTLCPINFDVLCAMNYIIRAPIQKMLSFSLNDKDCIYMLERACKAFLVFHLERDFESMTYYYGIKSAEDREAKK